MRSILPLVALLALTLTACSGSQDATAPADSDPPLAIEAPPSGSLSPDQLGAIARDIRQLEARPLADGAAEGRAALFAWLSGSPDVTVSLCTDIVSPLINSNSRYHGDLLTQFILSSAASTIEQPNTDRVAVNVDGLEGALAAYTVMTAQEGRRAQDRFMDSIAERAQNGTLESFVRSGLADC